MRPQNYFNFPNHHLDFWNRIFLIWKGLLSDVLHKLCTDASKLKRNHQNQAVATAE